ncbi:MAG: leucine-rich repeat protein [Bacteroidaceae bacterium]|nr:leucine-rich repeat protein [Bacteroidaceae bacterium]
MKKIFAHNIIPLVLTAVLTVQTSTLMAATEVHVATAGTLPTLLSTTDKELTITGSINGTDVKYLRELINAGTVTSLNISEARIVKGGEAYYESYTTENDIIGQYMFRECTKLKTITLPSTITAILANAFSKSGLTKVDIPNSVSRLGGDAFAYCSSLTTVVIGSRVSKLDQGVFYSSAVKTVYAKPMSPPATPAYFFSSNPRIIVYTDALDEYKASSWAQFGTITGKLEDTYPREADPSDAVNALIANYFEDLACTQLKAEFLSMTDEDLTAAMTDGGMPDFMCDIAVKLKNEAWKPYEKDFRIHSYNAFSDAAYWNTKMKSTGGSFMGNPTGIYSNSLDPIYVFVGSEVPADATLYIAGCVDNDLISSAKTGTRLKPGLNIVDGTTDALYYILYTADTKSMTKTLSQWPSITVHIEGGDVNGYYDVARHSDTDYKAILKAAKHNRFTVKSQHALFNFRTSTYKTVWPQTIDKSISWFDSLTVWQKDLMGYTVAVATGQRAGEPYYLTGGEAIFPDYYNNPNFAIEGTSSDGGYANSSPYRTCYNSLECIRNSFDVSRYELDDWCSAHECGHNNQGAINLEGGTESSNNLFSNYIRYLDGLATSVGSPLSTVMEEYLRREPFYVRQVDTQLRMYWQLYLYYHLAQHNTSFFPNLFKALREDPVTLWQSNTNNSGLKFVRKACEVAQEDLTDFFTVYGFFIPFTNMPISDYGSHTLTARKTDINRTLSAISQYPKNQTILFVEDRADYVLTTDFLTTAGQKRRDSDRVGQCGDLGQFTDYLPANAQPSSYTYLQADSLYAMAGSGGVGFKMLDGDNNLVYAANAFNFCVPTNISDGCTIFSVDADGTMHEVALAGNGAETVWLNTAGTLADSLSAQVIKATIGGTVNSSDFKYMRELIADGNLASIDLSEASIKSGGTPYLDNYRTATNAIGQQVFHGFTQLIAIKLPEKITRIDANAFSNSGLKEIEIPDNVTTIGEYNQEIKGKTNVEIIPVSA